MKSSPDMKNSSGSNENGHISFDDLHDADPRFRLQAVQNLTRAARLSAGEDPSGDQVPEGGEGQLEGRWPPVGTDVPEILTAFKQLLNRETDSYVAATVIRSIGVLGRADDSESVIPFLSDRAPRVRANAVETLGRLGNKKQLERLLPGLNDLNNRVRANAAVALKDEHPHRSLEVLRDMIRETDTRSRLSAAYACLEIGTDESAAFLEELTQDDNTQVASTAAEALRTLKDRGNEAAGRIIERLGDTFAGIGQADSFVMVDDGSLIKLTPDPDAAARQRSLLASLRSSFEIQADIDLKKTPRVMGAAGEPAQEEKGSAGKPTGEEKKSERRSRTLTGRFHLRASDDKYMMVGEIGRGGMGIILNALDTDIRREVAMKVMSGDHAIPREHIERFVEEVQVQGQLEHPHICPVHELGMDSNGRIYFTMKMVKGSSLAEEVKKARKNSLQPDARTLTGTLNTFLKICDGIAYAHSKGVIHRDLKPANIMVGDFGEVYVMDWGLAKILGRDDERRRGLVITDRTEEADTMKTMDGSVIGTPAYMPPEQAAGNVDGMDERSDIYSLGALLYELLTLESPFTGASPWDIIQKVRQEVPAPPSERAPRRDIPPELDAVVMKCMAKDINERYQSINELKHDIELYLSGRPIESMQYSLWQIVRKWIDRNRTLALSSLAVALVIVVSFAVSYYRISISEQEARAKEREAKEKLVKSLISQGDFHVQRRDMGKAVAAYRDARNLIIEKAFTRFPYIDLLLWKARYCKGGYREQVASLYTMRTDSRVKAVAFSPDGRLLATVGVDELIRLWDMKTMSPLPPIDNGGDDIYCVAFSPDSRYLATGDTDRTVRLWDIQNRSLLYPLKLHTDYVTSVAFSPDGTMLASGDNAGYAILWDLEEKRVIKSIHYKEKGITSLSFSPDGRLLATASQDETTRLWEARTGKPMGPLLGHQDDVNSVAFRPDSRTLVTGSRDKTVRIWDITQNTFLATLRGHAGEVTSVAVSPDGKTVASAGKDTTVRLWDTVHHKELSILRAHTNVVNTVAFSPDGTVLASGSEDMTVKLWDVKKKEKIISIDNPEAEVETLAVSPDGTILAAALYKRITGPIQILDAVNGREITTISGHAGSVYALCFSPDGKTLASAGRDEQIKLWDAARGVNTGTLQERDSLSILFSKVTGEDKRNVFALAFTPDGKHLVSGGQDRTLKLWDVANRELIKEWKRSLEIKALTFNPDGTRLACALKDKFLEIRDFPSMNLLHELSIHEGHVFAAAFSPGGRRLATGGTDNVIKLWDAETMKCLAVLKDHNGIINSLDFSPDGTLLASGSGDATIMLWNMEELLGDDDDEKHPIVILDDHYREVTSVKFSSDSSRLLSGSRDTTIKIWNIGEALKPIELN